MSDVNTGSISIGVDLGGTNLRVAAMTREGKILNRISVPAKAEEGPDSLLNRIIETVRREIDHVEKDGLKPAGIGVGVPGIIYMDRGVVQDAPNLPGWHDLAVRDRLQEGLKYPVILENDANAAALGENWLGRGREVEHLCLLTLGTGVGGGFVMNERVWHGFRGMAGEAGHINIYPDGIPCNCDGRGCLEQYASATAVIREGEEAARVGRSKRLKKDFEKSGKLTAKLIADAAHQGDKTAIEIYRDVGRALGIGLGTIINLLELPLCLLSGGMAAAWDLFAPAMFEQLNSGCYIYRTGGIRIEPAELDDDAGLFGAAYLPFQQ